MTFFSTYQTELRHDCGLVLRKAASLSMRRMYGIVQGQQYYDAMDVCCIFLEYYVCRKKKTFLTVVQWTFSGDLWIVSSKKTLASREATY